MNIIAVSHWLADNIRISFFNKYPIKTIYNGIDTKIFSPNPSNNIRGKYGIPEKKFMIMGVANVWTERKGLNDYFKLSELLHDDEIIVLIGATKKIIRNLPHRVIGIERIDNAAELAQLYSTADVLCNLSFEETFGKTTVEGLACGTPAIVYNSTASPELISPDTGFLIELGDMTGIRNAIDTLKKRGKSFYSQKCRARALRMFDKDKQWADYVDLYEQLLEQPTHKKDL